ncbi:MAG: hypothetical protein AUG49_26600 [Catenulispora sp. 13_1_20CM_3_70_7]|nr:MAG: hypothetical protein AUG49_26600 [Catenulispora sp. 13_1_20CM_3_70_7]
MTGTVTLWVFGLLCFVVAFAKQAASGAGISLPGPETRGARIGVVLVGVIALALGTAVRPGDPRPSPTPTPTASSASSGPVSVTASTSTASTSAPGSTTPASSATAGQSAPAWSGSVGIPGITAGSDIEFDKIPPGPSPSVAQRGIYAGHDPYADKWHLNNALSGHNRLGVWTGTGRPTGAECSAWADTHPNGTVEVTVGTMVCLKTEDGDTALLTIDSLSADDGTINATATVWAPS